MRKDKDPPKKTFKHKIYFHHVKLDEKAPFSFILKVAQTRFYKHTHKNVKNIIISRVFFVDFQISDTIIRKYFEYGT